MRINTLTNMADPQLTKLIQDLTAIRSFAQRYSKIIRDARDYVIDAGKTGRTKLSEAEKAEKTIFGMKVEAYLRYEFAWGKGPKLDFYFNCIEFDSKATVGKTWMVPPEAVGELCLLTLLDEKRSVYSAGVIRASLTALTKGKNQDKKRSVSAIGKQSIHWLIKDELY
tara:strand:- start:1826 stop:2329 length:504 start_codon:yes stop_codon:yes gene_type:complete